MQPCMRPNDRDAIERAFSKTHPIKYFVECSLTKVIN
jgi:hypothetical protein